MREGARGVRVALFLGGLVEKWLIVLSMNEEGILLVGVNNSLIGRTNECSSGNLSALQSNELIVVPTHSHNSSVRQLSRSLLNILIHFTPVKHKLFSSKHQKRKK